MKFQITTVAGAALTAFYWWSADAGASCQGCPAGYECFMPDGDYHRGYCVRVMTAKEMLRVGQNCLCENDGSLRHQVKLYPCPCVLSSEGLWHFEWEQLGERLQSLEPHELSELPKQHGYQMRVVTDWSMDDFADCTKQTKKLQLCD